MRKLYFLMLILTGLTGFAFSPPEIQTPTDVSFCDGASINLTTKTPEILGALNPNDYTVTYHLTATDSEFGTSPISNPSSYTTGTDTVIYVRVVDNAVPTDYSLTAFWVRIQPWTSASIVTPSGTVCGDATVTFQAISGSGNGIVIFNYAVNGGALQTITSDTNGLATIALPQSSPSYDVVLESVQTSGNNNCNQIIGGTVHIETQPVPNAGEPIDIIMDLPVGGGNSAQFDLTDNFNPLMNGQSGLTVKFYLTSVDAETNNTANQINPLLVPAYGAISGTQIWARVENLSTGCFVVKAFHLYVRHPDADYVFIPDANFKAKLLAADGATQTAQDLIHNFTEVDINHDGEIQFTEAENISLLNLGMSEIADLTGIEAFVNIAWLNAGYNPQLQTINTSTLPLLSSLSVSHCALNSLNFTNNPALYSLSCEYNNLTSLDFSNNPLMNDIHCQNNAITVLDLTGLTALTDVVASNNLLTSIDTADLSSILTFDVGANHITALDLTGLATLQSLICDENQIDSLNTTDCVNLTTLRCAANQMTYLDVSNSLALSTLDCSTNTLLTLDLSANSALCNFSCFNNSSMTWLNIKNGVDTCYTSYNVSFITNSLQQLCCDDNEVAYFRNYFLTSQGINVNVNSYCSFVPGGDYNTIAFNVKYDANNNGCDVDDVSFANIRMNIHDGTNPGATFTDTEGSAHFYTQAGTFTLTPGLENPAWFSASPASIVIPFSNTNNNVVNQDFCVMPIGNHPDLEIAIAPLTNARPGFDAIYKIVVKNKGNQIVTQTDHGITFTYDHNRMQFVEASEGISLIEGPPGEINWDLINLYPFESKSITIRLRVNTPGDAVPVNNGDTLTFTAVTNPVAGEETPTDNSFVYDQTVVGSFDPNDIVCLEGDVVSPVQIGNYLHYIINFENTGTAPAENIVVRDVIDTNQYDITSLQLLDSSASVTTRLTGSVAEFIFPSINLHSGGHGNILLKIRSNNALVEGSSVSKRANIFFDYNFPIETPAANTVFQSLSNPDVPRDVSILIYPNPTKGNINVNCKNTIKSIELYDVQGRVLQTNLVNANQTNVDISNQSKGIYFLRIISDKGMKVEKIVRE